MVVDWPTHPNDTIVAGTWLVGDDVSPGRYRTVPTGLCYWSRLSGLAGGIGDIIANEATSAPTYVEITASDVAFKTDPDCGVWSKVE